MFFPGGLHGVPIRLAAVLANPQKHCMPRCEPVSIRLERVQMAGRRPEELGMAVVGSCAEEQAALKQTGAAGLDSHHEGEDWRWTAVE